MHSIKFNRYAFSLPACRDELSPVQAKAIAFERMRPETVRRIVRTLIQFLPSKAKKRLKKVDPCALHALGECISWIWNEPEIEAGDTIKPLISGFQHRGTWYAFPQADFNDVTMEEWCYIDHELQTIRDEPAQAAQSLHSLLATICRPLRSKSARKAKDFDGYPREYFNIETVAAREKRLEKAPKWVYAIMQDFCLRASQMIIKRYADLFHGESSGGEGYGWIGLVMSIAESGVFGSYDQVNKKNMHDILLYTAKRAKEDRKRKLEMEKMKMRRG